jgi:hypothetical protein
MELVDVRGRTVCVSSKTSLEGVLDAILRMNADGCNWRKPITIYICAGNKSEMSSNAVDTLVLCDVIQSLRSRVFTIGMGLLTSCEALALAAGERGHRYLLPHSIICIGQQEPENLPLPNGCMGLRNHTNGPSIRTQVHSLLETQINGMVRQLGLPVELWQEPAILSARQAIAAGFADCIAPALSRKSELLSELSHKTTIIHETKL